MKAIVQTGYGYTDVFELREEAGWVATPTDNN